ncbi:MAG TPA: kynureninase, partial [Micromonosporaceae bacterium]|nr:kynureninase [Micromonosporaceae bacterium]
VGCTYKFLNAGPGAPAFLYVRAEHRDGFAHPLRGWMGVEEIFAMDEAYRPAAGLRRALSGTPPVAGLVCVAEGAELLGEAGIEQVRAKSLALTRMLITLADEWLAPLGYTLASPRADAERGGHVTLDHPRAAELTPRFIDAGVILDFRAPHGIRLGPAALSTSFTELWTGLDTIRRLS